MRRFLAIFGVLMIGFPFIMNGQCTADYSFKKDSVRKVRFTDNSYGSTRIDRWSWDFGDSTYSSVRSPVHTYANYGNYNVCLSIITQGGCTDTLCSDILLNDTSCSAGFIVDSVSPQTYTFRSNNSVDSNNFWRFGDGYSTYGANVQHSFATPGSYLVCLYLNTSSFCKDTLCKTITKDTVFYSISGRVFGENAISGVSGVVIYRADKDSTAAPVDTAQMKNDSFFFKALPAGIYKVKAISSDSAYKNTYYGNTASWTQAYNLTLDANIGGIDLQLISGTSIDYLDTRNVRFKNPVSDYLTLHGPFSKNSVVAIYNLHGVELRKKYIRGSSSEITLDLKGMSKGIYILKIKSREDQFISKFIKR